MQDDLGFCNDVRMAQRILMNAPVDTGLMGPFVLGWLAAQQADGPPGKTVRAVKKFVKLPAGW
jgi:hypothetical protein